MDIETKIIHHNYLYTIFGHLVSQYFFLDSIVQSLGIIIFNFNILKVKLIFIKTKIFSENIIHQ